MLESLLRSFGFARIIVLHFGDYSSYHLLRNGLVLYIFRFSLIKKKKVYFPFLCKSFGIVIDFGFWVFVAESFP